MKILFLTRKFYPDIGGVEKHVLEVSKELLMKRYKITVVAEKPSNSKLLISNYKLGKDGIEIYRIPITVGEKLKKFQIWYWFIKNLNLIEEADIIHGHDVFFWLLPFRFLFPFKKIFVTFHGWEGDFPVPQKSIWQRKIAEKFTKGNICIGEYIEKWYGIKADYVSYGGLRNINLVHLENKSLSTPFVCFLGRLEKDTGLPVYLEAINKIKETMKRKVDFCFVGDGRLKTSAGERGKVTGFVKNPWEYAKQSSIIFTSSYLFTIEALYFKKKVFSVYDNPLKYDTLRMSPFYKWIDVESDPFMLAKKVTEYLKNPKKDQPLIDKAYKWARQQTWEKVANLYLELWKR